MWVERLFIIWRKALRNSELVICLDTAVYTASGTGLAPSNNNILHI